MTTVWVSRVPGSVKPPLTVVEPFSLIVDGEADAVRFEGARLLTVTEVEPLPEPPSSSVTVTELVAVGSSSRYWWLVGPKARTPAARLSVVFIDPSPQLMTTMWVSSVPGSVNVPLRLVDWFSLIVPALSVRLTPAGATFVTTTEVVPVALPRSSSLTVMVTVYVPLSPYAWP